MLETEMEDAVPGSELITDVTETVYLLRTML